MFNKFLLYLKKIDWIIFFAVFLLCCFGLLEIYSIALSKEGLDLLNFKKQISFIGIGFFLLFFFAFLDYHILKNYSIYIYLLGFGLLVSVLIFGSDIRGTRGWFSFFGFGLQPVEFTKIVLLIFLAKFFSSFYTKIKTLKPLLLSGLGSFILIVLVLLQPDFGSSLLLVSVWILMLFFSGFKKKYFFIIGLVMILIFAGSWFFLFENYQKNRVLTFLKPDTNSLDEGYNISQAMIAIGSGGFLGRGVGFGSQSQLKFLPEAQNDFIFAVISEELGFLGVCLLFFFFGVFYFRALYNLPKIKDDFGIFFILGASGLIFIEMFINIGMNIGLLPVVGISLPFVSYGGSAIVSHLIIIGIIESIIIRSKINY